MKTDVLSDVFRAVRLTGAMYFDFELSSPWVRVVAPPSCAIAAKVMPGAQRVIEYHLIARGSCWGHAVGQEPIRLREANPNQLVASGDHGESTHSADWQFVQSFSPTMPVRRNLGTWLSTWTYDRTRRSGS